MVRAATTADTWKAALFVATATINAATTAYAVTGEVVGTGYTAGGVTFAWIAPTAGAGTTAYSTPSASFAWTTVTLATSFDCCHTYNATQANRSALVQTFGATTVTAGNFSLTMPVNDATTGLLRLV